MAFWNLSGRRGWHHASDEALAVVAMAGPEGSPDGLVAHAASCPTCSQRLAALEGVLATARRGETRAADQAFPQARLDRQRESILKRIGGSRASARILPFPGAGRATELPRRHAVRRSVAAAAVVGLVVGALAGRLIDFRAVGSPGSAEPLQTTASLQAVRTIQASALADEAFLGEFEAALGSPRVEPLVALDALTPRAADERILP